jgi:LysR family transcriptional regulator, hypochlorite-specific transcription factor HypT
MQALQISTVRCAIVHKGLQAQAVSYAKPALTQRQTHPIKIGMEMRWLQDFLTVAETGNFTRAAALRHTSQAAFSRRIQQLEAWLGATLIDRSLFPTRLTPEGETFRRTASDLLRQIVDARAEVSPKTDTKTDHVRIAVPYALATARMPDWWHQWAKGWNVSCALEIGNVHDLGTSLMSGTVDFIICFEAPQQPITVDADRVETLLLGRDTLRPYVSANLLARGGFVWPGTQNRPTPLLMYSKGVYFARLVDLIMESAATPLASRTVITSDMADMLRNMARGGQGVAWLPECTVADCNQELTLLPGDEWGMPLSIMAYRLKENTSRSVERLWRTMSTMAAQQS